MDINVSSVVNGWACFMMLGMICSSFKDANEISAARGWLGLFLIDVDSTRTATEEQT
jgi:hypothetical protein